MGHADHFVLGSNNVWCDICGRKFKSYELRKMWDGTWACKQDWSPRHPQDFVKGVKDEQRADLDRPEGPDTFTSEAQTLTMWGNGT